MKNSLNWHTHTHLYLYNYLYTTARSHIYQRLACIALPQVSPRIIRVFGLKRY